MPQPFSSHCDLSRSSMWKRRSRTILPCASPCVGTRGLREPLLRVRVVVFEDVAELLVGAVAGAFPFEADNQGLGGVRILNNVKYFDEAMITKKITRCPRSSNVPKGEVAAAFSRPRTVS